MNSEQNIVSNQDSSGKSMKKGRFSVIGKIKETSTPQAPRPIASNIFDNVDEIESAPVKVKPKNENLHLNVKQLNPGDSEYNLTIFRGLKIPYTNSRDLVFDYKHKKENLAYTIKMNNQQERNKLQIEESKRGAVDDLFGVDDFINNDNVVEELKRSDQLIVDQIYETFDVSVGGRNVFSVTSNNPKKRLYGSITISSFDDIIVKIFPILNPSECGMLLVKMCFGGFINKNKITPILAKNALGKMKKIHDELKNFKLGSQHSLQSPIYIKIMDVLNSGNLDEFKNDASLMDQINNLTTLLSRLSSISTSSNGSILKVAFPEVLNANFEGKVINLTGVPTENVLVNFYSPEMIVKQTSQSKQNHDDDNYDDEDDRGSSRDSRFSNASLRSNVIQNSNKRQSTK